MSSTVITQLADAEEVAARAASDLADKLLALLESQSRVHLVLTGGTVGIMTLERLAPLLTGKNLSKLELWWGDERFVEASSNERNFVSSSSALLDMAIPEENIHQMPSLADGDLEEASAAFASQIEALAPKFDIVLLGMGPDGHVASLFPSAQPKEYGSWIVAESNSPKPPAQRISMSFQALCSAKEVWFLVSGKEKSNSVASVFAGSDLPAGQVLGTHQTRWYLDQSAASEIIS